MSGPAVRIVSGAPEADELAALLMALHAVSTPDRPTGPPPPSAAPWPRPTTPLTAPAPAWSTHRRPAWQDT
ncbi:acyl-CoA carboxylase epsilon subunit [Streptomyces turgidiscabies]|uniref:Acyl-CoA carboxylase epsilon subunit n=1 Tax=Streptomyces turgidiscabies (strain Car8) TaxID=698760 RepID=L7EV34_STRT8|nr:acyl-CoA carboxylase epsilon subunit [Streptomyces turgidiscabies]ELP63273.1 hypothetical protein STRTUCAR8_03262 [Streptomyces turgidiscabies Car8]MDX3494366.1 acyl-CoA carboxylase epsilon subunit [Streptomyces turgidiscabies]GAQ74645.1 hypothetical protein T45_06425 [Streptomyces turgidiscabies]